MKTWWRYRVVLLILLFGLLIACSKSEVRAKKLTGQDRWIFTELRIGNSTISQFPKWKLPNEPLDKEFVQGVWTHYDGSSCSFLWRFDYYEGSFSFMPDPAVIQDPNDKAYIQCDNLSGSYIVLTEKKKLFEFETLEASGYPGVNIFIQIQPL